LAHFKDVEIKVGAVRLGEQALAHIMLSVIDEKWKDHLYDLDQLRAAIQFRAWGQKDPLVEYKQEAFEMFKGLIDDLRSTFTERWLKLQIQFGPPRGAASTATAPLGGLSAPRKTAPMVATKPDADGLVSGGGTATGPRPPAAPPPGARVPAANPYTGVGRNDPCPCGSGKKFKKCHGAAM
jgi:preprotein translocase subunit SecA